MADSSERPTPMKEPRATGGASLLARGTWFGRAEKWVSALGVADHDPTAPEEDPEAALEALAEGSAPESPARRRRLARAALFAIRDAHRSARIGIGLAVMALLLALGVGVLALSRDDAQPGRTGSVFDDVVAEARPGTVYVRARGVGQEAAASVGADGRLVGINTILFTGSSEAPGGDQGYAIGVDRGRDVLSGLR